MQVLYIFYHLLQAGSDGIAATAGIASVESIEDYGFVLSFIFKIPLYFVEKDTKPNKAKAALKWSLISWGVTAVFLVIYFIFVFGMVFMLGM